MAKYVIPAAEVPPTGGIFRFRIVTDDRNSFSAWTVIIDIPTT